MYKKKTNNETTQNDDMCKQCTYIEVYARNHFKCNFSLKSNILFTVILSEDLPRTKYAFPLPLSYQPYYFTHKTVVYTFPEIFSYIAFYSCVMYRCIYSRFMYQTYDHKHTILNYHAHAHTAVLCRFTDTSPRQKPVYYGLFFFNFSFLFLAA